MVRVEDMLHPYVAFGIMPLFAFANAGVSLKGLDLGGATPLAVVMGIVLAAVAAVRLKLTELPDGVRCRELVLLGILGGIGFTMSIFIANLAFEEWRVLAAAKFGVLVGSALAAALALTLARSKSAALARQG